MSKVSPYLLALLSGALAALAYRVPGAWPLSFVALVPLLLAVRASRARSEAFWAGTLAGLVIMGNATSWFFAVLPLPDSFGVTSLPAQFVFVLISWTLVTLSTGPLVGLFALVARSFDFSKGVDAVAASALFVGGEYLRMLSFNALTMNVGIHNPDFFSLGFVGWPLMDNDAWRQLAAFGGLYIASFVVVLVNALVVLFLVRKGRLRAIGIPLLAAFVALVSFLPVIEWREAFDAPPNNSVRLSLISLPPSTTQDEEATEAHAFIRDSSEQGTNLILLPEDARALLPFAPHTAGEYLSSTSTAVVIDSGMIRMPNARPIRAFASDRLDQTAVRDKLVLTPQGEYIPYLFRLFLRALGAQESEERFDESRGYSTGMGDGVPLALGPLHASVMFCLEAMMPGLGKRLADEQGSGLLLLPSSHSWFQPSPMLERDVLRFGQLQAVEAHAPLAASVRAAPALLLDRYGRVEARFGGGDTIEERTFTVPVDLRP